jgi:hypothetical protein
MMKGTTLCIKTMKQLSPQRSADEYVIDFQTLDLQYKDLPEAPKKINFHRMRIGITDVLSAIWANKGLDKGGREKTLYEIAHRHIIEKIRENTLSDWEELELGSNSGYSEPPFDPELIRLQFGNDEDIIVDEEQGPDRLIVGTQITDILDNINAMFYEQHKELLFRPKEFRTSLELVRPARTKEDFVYRIAALCNVIDGLNKNILQKLTKEKDQKVGSIVLLGDYLISKGEEGKLITKTLQDILKVRKGYPVHSDSIEGVIEGHKNIGIGYPIENYDKAWGLLLSAFKKSCQEILKVFSKLY